MIDGWSSWGRATPHHRTRMLVSPRRFLPFALTVLGGAVLGALIVYVHPASSITAAAAVLLVGPLVKWLPGAAVVSGRGLGAQLGVFAAMDIMALSWVVRWLPVRLLRKRWSALDAVLGAFVAWLWLTSALADVRLAPLARVTLYAGVGLAAQSLPPESVLLLGLYLVGDGLAQLVIAGLGAGLQGVTVGDPHQFGIMAACVATFAIAARKVSSSPVARRWLGAGVALLVAAAFLTGRRSVWVALIAAGLTVAFRKRPRLAAVLIATAVLTAWATARPVSERMGLRVEAISLRTESIAEGVRLWLARPFVGWGWAWFAGQGGSEGAVSQSPYNLVVNTLAASGLIGGLLLAAYMGALLARAWASQSRWLPFLVFFIVLSASEMTMFAGSSATLLFFFVAGEIHGGGLARTGAANVRTSSPDGKHGAPESLTPVPRMTRV
ncbi:MAG: O-antigen ligase family protein [Armatimonadota bacterium]|nr:O-antigen ligase family protein [Armatimonadota bacterium]